jgi:hypothetical protein
MGDMGLTFFCLISLPGPPITKNSSIIELITNKVVVGIGCERTWSARNLPFDIAWVSFFLPILNLLVANTKHTRLPLKLGAESPKRKPLLLVR